VPNFPCGGLISSLCCHPEAAGRNHGKNEAGGFACGSSQGKGAVKVLASRQAGTEANPAEALGGRREAVRNLQHPPSVAVVAVKPHGSAKAGG